MVEAVTGTLYVVGTPIGNLGDMTLRAAELLRRVEHVAAEDTRRTRALLSHLGAAARVHRIDAHAAPAQIDKLLERLDEGHDVALVTDAGMPAVSDPGSAMVQRARERGVPVRVLPGPSAVTAAIAVSGLVEGGFCFLGFLARRGARRAESLEGMQASPHPVVLFEAPQRTQGLLEDLAERMPQRQAMVARELTKLHEEHVYGTLAQLAERQCQWRGEVTIVLGSHEAVATIELDSAELDARMSELLARGYGPKQVAAELAPAAKRPKRDLYRRALELSKSG